MEETTLDLRELWKIVKRRKYIIIGITLLCMIFGLVMSFIPKKVETVEKKEELYKSTASVIIGIFPDAKSENIKDITMLNQQIVKTYGAIANSRTVAEKTINELNLNTKTDKFMDNIKVNVNAEAQIVTITYGNKEEKDVEKVTDTYSKIFMEEAKKIYPEAKLKVLDAPSKAEKIAKEDFDKIGMPQNPNHPTQPAVTENKGKSKKLIIVVSALLGLMVGFGAAFIMEYMDNSIRKKEKAEAILGMPIIGEIKKENKEEASESYKILRTALQYKNMQNDTIGQVLQCKQEVINEQVAHNTLMITSPSKGDGKTTTAVNLATSFAEVGFKTLIIDANGRNPMVHTMLELDNEKGLSNILTGENVDVEKCKEDNLYVLTWGTSNINPADAFVKANVNEVLNKFRQEFNYIIIDTPTITDYADAGILSKAIDEALFIIQENKTDRQQVLNAKKFIDTIGIKVSGVCWIE